MKERTLLIYVKHRGVKWDMSKERFIFPPGRLGCIVSASLPLQTCQKRGILHLRGRISHFLDFQMLKVASSPKRSLTMLSQGTEKKKPGGSNSTSCLGLGKESFPVVIFKIFHGQLRSPVVVHVGLAHVEHVLSQGGNLKGNIYGSNFSMLQEIGSSSRDAGDNGSLLTRCFRMSLGAAKSNPMNCTVDSGKTESLGNCGSNNG